MKFQVTVLDKSKHERLKTIRLLTQLSDVTPLYVENNRIFTQLLENNRTFVLENNKIDKCRRTPNFLLLMSS